MLIEIRGVIYESVKHAASVLGVSKYAIYSALRRGGMDSVGLGNTQSHPIDLDGLKFRSMGAAGIALGFNRSFVRYTLARGSSKAIKRLEDAIKLYKQEHNLNA